MQEFVILLIIVAVSALANWIQRGREEAEEELEEERSSGTPPPLRRTESEGAEPRPTSGRRERDPDIEEQLREWFGERRSEPTVSDEGSTPPEAPAPREGPPQAPHRGSDRPSTTWQSPAKAEEPARSKDESEADKAQISEQAKRFQKEIGDPFARPHRTPYKRSTPSPYQLKEPDAYAQEKLPYAIRPRRAKGPTPGIRHQLRNSRSARQIFVGSIILGPPKSLDERRSHYF